MAKARAGNRQPCPHPRGTSGWRRRWQDSQKHQALRVHQEDLGNLEDPAGRWGKKKKKKGKNGLENEKVGPEDPGGTGGPPPYGGTRTGIPMCSHSHREGWDAPSCPRPVPSHPASCHPKGPLGLLVPRTRGGGDTHRSARRAGETTGTSWTLGRRTESGEEWLPCHPVPISVTITTHSLSPLPPHPCLHCHPVTVPFTTP